MSHLTADALFVLHVSRDTPDVTPCYTSPPQGARASTAHKVTSVGLKVLGRCLFFEDLPRSARVCIQICSVLFVVETGGHPQKHPHALSVAPLNGKKLTALSVLIGLVRTISY